MKKVELVLQYNLEFDKRLEVISIVQYVRKLEERNKYAIKVHEEMFEKVCESFCDLVDDMWSSARRNRERYFEKQVEGMDRESPAEIGIQMKMLQIV